MFIQVSVFGHQCDILSVNPQTQRVITNEIYNLKNVLWTNKLSHTSMLAWIGTVNKNSFLTSQILNMRLAGSSYNIHRTEELIPKWLQAPMFNWCSGLTNSLFQARKLCFLEWSTDIFLKITYRSLSGDQGAHDLWLPMPVHLSVTVYIPL